MLKKDLVLRYYKEFETARKEIEKIQNQCIHVNIEITSDERLFIVTQPEFHGPGYHDDCYEHAYKICTDCLKLVAEVSREEIYGLFLTGYEHDRKSQVISYLRNKYQYTLKEAFDTLTLCQNEIQEIKILPTHVDNILATTLAKRFEDVGAKVIVKQKQTEWR